MASALSLKSTKPISNGALKSADLPTRIKVLNWGENPTIEGEGKPLILDDESAKVFYANQRQIGRSNAPIDFNHNTVRGTKAYEDDKEPRAIAGYGIPTIIPGDGLYLEYANYTPSGEKSARDYADLSPAVFCDEDNRVIGLHSVALTPAGAVENLSFYSADGSPKTYSAESLTSLMDVCSSKVDVHAADDKKPYGNVDYADPGYKEDKKGRYPLDTEAHVRAANSYFSMPKNHKGYSADNISAIKSKIASKAKDFGITLQAHSADQHEQVNAYVTDPYTGLDNMNNENMDYFRQKLGLPDGTSADDIIQKLRATWEGLEKDKQPVKDLTPGASVDPTVRNAKMDEGKVSSVISFSAVEELLAKRLPELVAPIQSAYEAKLKDFSAKFDTLQADKDAQIKAAQKNEREQLVAEASRNGKVIPLSVDEVNALDIGILKSLVAGLPKNSVPIGSTVKPFTPTANGREAWLNSAGGALIDPSAKPFSADSKNFWLAGSKEQAVNSMTEFFSERGVKSGGPREITPQN